MNTENSKSTELSFQRGMMSLNCLTVFIQCQIFKVISNIYIYIKHKTSLTNPPIQIYINRINNRLVFRMKDEYKRELQTPETMKLFGHTKKLIDKTKNGEHLPLLEWF